MAKLLTLGIIKAVHTLIWLFFNAVIFYLLYAAVSGRIGVWVWLGYGLIALEGLTLLAFNFFCPLTLMARRYSDSAADNFDIYLPNWLAKNTKRIYTSLVLISALLTVYQLLKP
ncbi:hypothetical protein [Hymenobacter sp. BT491]|uniref:hypothetical protein n=1 Tax=Hymenobacter sp. BT491 TaxID=2766779 RepID=UPI0016538AFD|nr:hypothetical protein [Hymenobacter sp. BT491]MBC6990554.1 hypothetical protein [Hymenobacter sp. BT491]